MEPLLPDFYSRKSHHILDDVVGCFNDMIQSQFSIDQSLIGSSEFGKVDFEEYAISKLGYKPDFKWSDIK